MAIKITVSQPARDASGKTKLDRLIEENKKKKSSSSIPTPKQEALYTPMPKEDKKQYTPIPTPKQEALYTPMPKEDKKQYTPTIQTQKIIKPTGVYEKAEIKGIGSKIADVGDKLKYKGEQAGGKTLKSQLQTGAGEFIYQAGSAVKGAGDFFKEPVSVATAVGLGAGLALVATKSPTIAKGVGEGIAVVGGSLFAAQTLKGVGTGETSFGREIGKGAAFTAVASGSSAAVTGVRNVIADYKEIKPFAQKGFTKGIETETSVATQTQSLAVVGSKKGDTVIKTSLEGIKLNDIGKTKGTVEIINKKGVVTKGTLDIRSYDVRKIEGETTSLSLIKADLAGKQFKFAEMSKTYATEKGYKGISETYSVKGFRPQQLEAAKPAGFGTGKGVEIATQNIYTESGNLYGTKKTLAFREIGAQTPYSRSYEFQVTKAGKPGKLNLGEIISSSSLLSSKKGSQSMVFQQGLTQSLSVALTRQSLKADVFPIKTTYAFGSGGQPQVTVQPSAKAYTDSFLTPSGTIQKAKATKSYSSIVSTPQTLITKQKSISTISETMFKPMSKSLLKETTSFPTSISMKKADQGQRFFSITESDSVYKAASSTSFDTNMVSYRQYSTQKPSLITEPKQVFFTPQIQSITPSFTDTGWGGIGGGVGGIGLPFLEFGGRLGNAKKVRFKKKYFASIEASVFKIKGRPSKVAVITGLGIRPITK